MKRFVFLWTLVVVSTAFFMGVNAPVTAAPLSSVIVIIAYSVYDIALVSLFRSAVHLLISVRVVAAANTILLYAAQTFVIVKIILRIVVEDPSDLADITTLDEVYYAVSLGSFLVNLVDLWIATKTPPEEGIDANSTAPQFSNATISKLISLVFAERLVLAFASVCLVLAAVSQATIPHFIGKALDAVKDNKPVGESLKGLVIGALGYAVFSAMRGSSFILLGARVNVRMRSRLFAAIVNQDIAFFDKTKTGDLSSRMTQDVQKVCDQVQLNVNYFTRNLIATVVTLSFMVSLSSRLTCLSTISIPVTVVISQRYGQFIKKISKEIQDKLADCNAASEEVFSSIHTVRSFGAEDLETTRFGSLVHKVYRLSKRSARMYVPYLAVCISLPYAASILIIFYGAKLTFAGVIEASSLISFVLYLEMLNESVGAMGDIYASITGALGAAEKVFTILEKKPEFPVIEYPLHPGTSVRGDIQFKDVCFAYPSRPDIQVLNSITLEVKAGTVAALVGGSGQGKSSCLALLQRWYCQTSGQVLLDGMPIRRYDPEEYHRIVTCVNQEPLLLARTIRENILFGLVNSNDPVPEHLERRVYECAKLANAHAFISAMPDGYDTQVGMRGVQLSGGQKQRIAIARALVRNPKVLLLDEATSALDSESEKQVQHALDTMMSSEMTLVVVAHRLSTVRNADVIYVIDKGCVIEKGRHSDLVKNEQSAYFRLVKNQIMHESANGH